MLLTENRISSSEKQSQRATKSHICMHVGTIQLQLSLTTTVWQLQSMGVKKWKKQQQYVTKAPMNRKN